MHDFFQAIKHTTLLHGIKVSGNFIFKKKKGFQFQPDSQQIFDFNTDKKWQIAVSGLHSKIRGPKLFTELNISCGVDV